MEPQQTVNQNSNDVMYSTLSMESRVMETLTPQQSGQPCPTCGSQARLSTNGSFTPSFVYAIGRVEPRFPSIGVEKELAQVIGRDWTPGTDRQVLFDFLQRYRYLARELCWVFSIQGLETYILQPRDPADFALLVEALDPKRGPLAIDAAIGLRGPIAPPEMCNGLMVPIVLFDQLYLFDRDALLKAIPRPKGTEEDRLFQPASEEVLDRIVQMSDNAGATDEHRSLNYLAVRYPGVYALAAEQFGRNASLAAVEVRPSTLSGTRRIVDVIFAYTNRSTDVTDKFFVRVDVTEKFPFLVSRMSPYLNR